MIPALLPLPMWIDGRLFNRFGSHLDAAQVTLAMHQVRYLIDERLPVDLSESLVFSGDSLGRLRVRAEQAAESSGRPALPGCVSTLLGRVPPSPSAFAPAA